MLNQYNQYGLDRQDPNQQYPMQNPQAAQQRQQDFSGQQPQLQSPQAMNPQATQNQQQAAQNGQEVGAPQRMGQPLGNGQSQPAAPQPQAPNQQPRPMMGRYNFQNRNPPNPRQFMNQMGRSFGR